MPENNSLLLTKPSVWQIDYTDIVGVDVDGFIAYDEFFVLFFFISQHEYICISDIQLIL